MSTQSEKNGNKGLRYRSVSTVIGISLVLFMIGLVLGGVFGLENVDLEAIAKSKAYHKYVFEVEDFKSFDAHFKLFKKQLQAAVVWEKISISEENKEITVVCLAKNAENFLYKLKKTLHDNGFRLYKFKEEYSEKPIRL